MDTENETQGKKFTKSYTFKILFLVFLILVLLIPANMVDRLIDERSSTASSAEEDIMEAWGSELVAAGPVIAIPGIRTEEVRTITSQDVEKINIVKKPFTLIVTPQKLSLKTNFKTEIRKRGIFSVPLFHGEFTISGAFDPTQALSSISPNEEVSLDKAELIIALSSQKGIRKIDQAVWNAKESNANLFFQPGNRGQDYVRKVKSLDSKYSYIPSGGGIYAELPELAANAKANFNIVITIHGGRLVRFLPLGQDTHTDIIADWQSPSFQGSFLPGSSNIKDDGFDATWDINYLSRDIPLHWKTEGGSRDYSNALFGVNFFRAIDTYSLNTRAVKYAILFLIIPFLTLFLFEIFTKKKIHPVPYLLSGIANIIFYLLLLSLSEQIQFYLAYIIAALAIVIMLTLYSRALLPSWNKSWYMGVILAISYILLYAVLNAESYALLVGSIWAFIVVALVMFFTRKLNWYGSEE